MRFWLDSNVLLYLLGGDEAKADRAEALLACRVNRYQLDVCDAMIAAAALKAGCNTLSSEDFSNGQRFDDRLTAA